MDALFQHPYHLIFATRRKSRGCGVGFVPGSATRAAELLQDVNKRARSFIFYMDSLKLFTSFK